MAQTITIEYRHLPCSSRLPNVVLGRCCRLTAPPSKGSANRFRARYRAHQVDADNLMLAIFGPLSGAAKSALNEPLQRVLHQHGEFFLNESSATTLA